MSTTDYKFHSCSAHGLQVVDGDRGDGQCPECREQIASLQSELAVTIRLPERIEQVSPLDIHARYTAATKLISALNKPRGSEGSREWIMTIPARPDYDPDCVLHASLRDVWHLLAALLAQDKQIREQKANLEKAESELERARQWDGQDELVTFRRDPNSGAGLWAVFIGDVPIHHFKESPTPTVYIASVQAAIRRGVRGQR